MERRKSCFVIFCLVLACFLSITSIQGNIGRKVENTLGNANVKPSDYSKTIYPGDTTGNEFTCKATGTIDWSFSSTGSEIEVLMCNWSQFESGNPTTDYYSILTAPSYGSSGTFTVPYSDTWNILFWNPSITTNASITYSATYHAPLITPGFSVEFTVLGLAIGVLGMITIALKKRQLLV